MMRRIYLIYYLFLSASYGMAQNIGVQFAKSLKVSAGISDNCEINDISTNSNGTIFAGGNFKGTVDFDPSETNSVNRTATNTNLFLARYNSLGELPNSASVIVAGDVSGQVLQDVEVQGQSVYILVDNSGVATFSTGVASSNVIASNGDVDVLIAKFDEGLTNIWGYSIGSTNVDFGGGISVDNSGNLYITGIFRGTVNFDPSGNGNSVSLTAGTDGDIFIAKYNTDGELVWANQIGGSFFDVGADVKLDASGNLYVAGRFNGTVDFDPGAGTTTISSNPNFGSVFIAKYDNNGKFIWAKSIIGAEVVSKLSLSKSGKIAITGYYQLNNADFDPSVGEALLPYLDGLPDTFVAVYNNDGNYLWSNSIGGPDSDLELPSDIYFLDDESVVVSGRCGGTVQFNQGVANPLTKIAQLVDGFIAKYDAAGTIEYAYLLGGAQADLYTKITLDGGNLFAYGRIKSPSIDFDPSPDGTAIVTSTSLNDSYFVKYDITGPQLIKNNTSESATFGTDLTVNIEVEDKESAVQSVALDYRGVSAPNASAFKRITLTKKSGNQFEGTIPSDDFDELGIEFRGFAVNTLGVESTSELITRSLNIPDGLTIPQYGSGSGDQEDYRIIAIPLQLNSSSVKSIFEDDLGKYDPLEYRLFGYTGQTTELNANSPLEPGKGYWIIIAGNDRPMNTGAGKTLSVAKGSPFTLSLNAGWNLIGNPYYFNIGWPEMKIANPGIGDLRIYDGSFSNGTVLDAMTGGFLFAESATTISFPVTKNPLINGGRTKETTQPNIRTALRPGEWEVLLNLSQQDKSYKLGGIGMRTDAKIEYDGYDNMTLPRFGNYLELNHGKELLGFHFSMDVVPTTNEGSWEFTVESRSAGVATLSWNQSSLSNLTNQLILFDVDNQWPVDMITNSSYEFYNSGVHHFKAVYGNGAFVKNELVAGQFVFHSIYPNPATDKIDLSFSTPKGWENENLTLNIFTTLGQRVQHHSYTIAESGLHQVSIPLQQPTGIYIVQLKLGDIRKQTRLVIK